MAIPEKDWRYSLYENIKNDNLDRSAKLLGLLTMLLMFFGFFANRKKIFRICLAVYAAPMILYYVSFEKLSPISLMVLLILTIMMFVWGASFDFVLKYSKTIFFHLVTWILVGTLLIVPAVYIRLFAGWEELQSLGLNMVSGRNAQLIFFLMTLLLGGAAILLLHFGFNQVMKPTLVEVGKGKQLPVVGIKIVLYLFWVGVFLFAKPLGVYLITLFFLGNIFREKDIVDDMMIKMKKYRLFLIFNYLLAIILGGQYVLNGLVAYDKILHVTLVIALICFLYFAVALLLKKVLKERIDLSHLIAVNPFFMLSFILFNRHLISDSLKNFFYLSSVITLIVIAFMV